MGTHPIMDGNTVKGVIFESKSGRRAILGKVVIDSTGDGDMFVAAGADFDDKLDNRLRTAWLAFVFWLVNVDIQKADEFKASQPEKHSELIQELVKLGGYPFYSMVSWKIRKGLCGTTAFSRRPRLLMPKMLKS